MPDESRVKPQPLQPEAKPFTEAEFAERRKESASSGESGMIPEPKTRAEMEAVMASHEMLLRKKPCVDCAFNKRSPENAAYSGPLSSEGGSIVDSLRQRVEDGDWMPFFCHEGMVCENVDGWRAVKGIPDNAVLQICHGWNELMQAKYRRWKAEREPA